MGGNVRSGVAIFYSDSGVCLWVCVYVRVSVHGNVEVVVIVCESSCEYAY
jgi:hypothetical protein